MLTAGVLGFQSLVLVVCIVVPVIAFVARRKWRLAVARNEEIKRLLVLASEESARAELEAAVEYGSAVATVAPNQCAVCYFPTTTRCARCKAVRYCSGKCQIIHWRQGHKDECHPPPPTQDGTDVGYATGVKASKEKDPEVCDGQFEFVGQAKLNEAFHTRGCSVEVPYEKDGCSEVESPTTEKGTASSSESCSTSFSGFSTSTASSDSADDISVSDSSSSDGTERSDGNISPDRVFDEIHTAFNAKDVDHSQPLSPKFASLVNSLSGATGDKLKETKSCYSEGENQCQATCQSISENIGVHESPIAEFCDSSSDFWECALDSVDSQIDSHSDGETYGSTELVTNKVSGGSLPNISFNLSRNSLGSAEKVSMLEDALHDRVDNKKHIDRSVLSGNINPTALHRRDVQSLNSKMQNNIDNEHRNMSHDFKSREIRSTQIESSKSADPSEAISLPSTIMKKADHVHENNKTPHHPKPRENGCSPSSVSNGRLTSIMDSAITRSKAGDNTSKDSASVSSQAPNSQNVKNGFKTSVQKVVEQFKGSKLPKQYPAGPGSEIAGRYSYKGLFPYDSFVKLYAWNKVELQPCGLINCGNSCFANVVLQCLAFTPPLTAYFLQGFHSKDCPKKDWCFTCEFERLILKAREGKSTLSPIGIVSKLPNIGSQLGNGKEEDAHEFLRYAVDTMQSVCLAEARVGASSPLEEETTLVGLTFGGYLRSKIKCMRCQGKSERQERMMDVTVEIEGDIGSLEEALRKFTSTETLDGENKYHCGRCNSYEKAKKKLTILEAPNVLTIALKRFQSGKFGKLNKPIRFPEILNMAPFMSGTSDKMAIYRLYGVIVHLDVMNAAFSGHYVCYVKNAQNKWFKVDDSTVTPADLEKVLSKGAYMLLYARCSPRAPRSIRNSMVSSDPKSKSTPSWIGGKNSLSKPKSPGNYTPASLPGSNLPEGSASYESFYSRFHRLQRILEEDSSSSDNSSLVSNNSDEGSCSTDSTRDSATSADDLSEYIFGDSGRGWRNGSDSEASSSSSSSPLYSKNSPLSDLDRYDSIGLETGGLRTDKGTDPFLRSDSTKRSSNLRNNSGSSSNSSTVSSRAKTDLKRLGSDSLNSVKYDVPVRRSTRERTGNN